MDNIRKRKTVELVTSFEFCENQQCKFGSKGSKKYETNSGDPFFVFKPDKGEMTFGKPIYLSIITLELSELHMYELFHDYKLMMAKIFQYYITSKLMLLLVIHHQKQGQ